MKQSTKATIHRQTSNRPAASLSNASPESEKRRLAIIELAREQRADEGRIEIDDNAILSEGNDNGCYVQAWVWADFSETRFDKEKQAEEPS